MLIRGLLPCLLAAMVAPAAANASLSWSAPMALNHHIAGIAITAVACPATTECTAVDVHGQEVTFNPQSPAGAAVDSLGADALTSVACPSVTQCSGVGLGGEEVTFDPQSPVGATPTTIDSGVPLTSVACPSATLCAAVDVDGGEVTFNPQSLAGAGLIGPTAIDPGEVLVAVSCYPDNATTSGSECTALDSNQGQVTFDPASASTAPGPVSTLLASPVALVCPSASICVEVNGGGRAGTFGPGLSSTSPLDGSTALSALTCYPGGPPTGSGNECTAVDVDGKEVTFDPGPSSTTPTVSGPVDAGSVLTSVSCPSQSQCTAVDVGGNMVTFDPQSPGTPALVAIDGNTRLSGLACPSASECIATDVSGVEATFEPGAPAAPTLAPVDAGTNAVYGIACPSAAQCTVVDGDGREATFNPQSPGGSAPVAIDPGHALFDVACPSAPQCTAVDSDGREVTFNPLDPGTPTPVAIDTGNALPAVACPSTSQCTALDGGGGEVTFDPQAPGAPAVIAVDPGPAVAVACPETTQCTAVDAIGQRATFDPQSPSDASVAVIDAGEQLNAIACRTPTDCVAVDAAGRAVEGDPRGNGAWAVNTLTSGGALTGLACPSALECVSVDAPGDAFVGTSGPLPPPPVRLASPSIAGTATQGRGLSDRHGKWSGAPTSYRYQWERCNGAGRACRAIAGGTGQTYVLARADVGRRIRVEEWAANIAGEGSGATSAATKVVRPLVAVSASRVSLTGLSKRKAKLAFTLTSGPREPPLRSVAVELPGVLRLSGAGSTGLAGGIVVQVRGRSKAFSATVKGQTVTIDLARTAGAVRITFEPRAFTVSGAVAGRVRSHRLKTVRLVLVTGGSRAARARLALTVKTF